MLDYTIERRTASEPAIGQVTKNKREAIVVRLDRRGRCRIDLRVFVTVDGEEPRSTVRDLPMPAERLADLMEVLQRAQAKALEMGWL